jgi:hypothetical protein
MNRRWELAPDATVRPSTANGIRTVVAFWREVERLISPNSAAPATRKYRRDASWARPLPFTPTAVRERLRTPEEAAILARIGERPARIGPVAR